jgi:hypothetical protein
MDQFDRAQELEQIARDKAISYQHQRCCREMLRMNVKIAGSQYRNQED